MSLSSRVVAAFERRFNRHPFILVRAPGRVNLIGEHTDYNEGFVMPMAIDRNVWIAASPADDARVRIHSMEFDTACEFRVDDLKEPIEGWGRYVQGVAWAMRREGRLLSGWDGVVGSDVPIGSGLSSSAALELAVARCFAEIGGIPWRPVEMAKLCQQAENAWVGMNCGIMDQLIAAAGERGHALLIDCRSLALEKAPLPADAVVVIMDTGTRRGLVESAYNERRRQCEAAASFFDVSFLRDISSAAFEAKAHAMEETLRKRCRHVVTENERTVAAFHAIKEDDLVALGKLMDRSHDSLRDDYEVTNDELNVMVSLARACSGVLGARMTGGGFGGCAIALVERSAVDDFSRRISAAYLNETGLEPALYVCNAENGASLEEIPSL